MDLVPMPNKKLKRQIGDDLDFHASKRWPDLEEVTISWRGSYGYVTAWPTMTDHVQICRIQYLGLDDRFGFALYQASTESYVDARLPDGSLTGTPRQALDTALGLYLNDPTAWHTEPPKD